MIRSFLSYSEIYKHHRWILLLGTVLNVIVLLSSIGLLTLSGWFLAATAMAGSSGIYTFNFILPAIGVRVLSITRTVGRYFERLIGHDATFRILQNLRVFIFKKLFPLFPAKFIRFHHGELLNYIIADVDTLNHIYLRIISPITGMFVTVIILTSWLSLFNVQIALSLFGAILLTILLLPLFFFRTGKLVSKNLSELQVKYRQQLTTWLSSQMELAIFDGDEHYYKKMRKTEQNWYQMQHRQSNILVLSKSLVQLVSGLVVIGILWMSLGTISENKANDLVVISVFCSLAIFEALSSTTSIFQNIGQVISSFIRITKITNQEPQINFVNKKIVEVPSSISLKLNQVSFTYEGQYRKTLENISFNVEAGTHMVVLGRTGCGKSTMLQLLTRAWDPQSGFIFLNDIPLTQFSKVTLRKSISVVPQRTYLFSATLRDNLLLAESNAKDEKLRDVLNQVDLNKLLENNGLNSWLGDGGRQLSGGEMRRLSIARSLLHNAPLILLDEPTEGLDAKSEKQILYLLADLMKEKTVIMVTHRLRWLENFDKFIVMDNGRIINQGNQVDYLMK